MTAATTARGYARGEVKVGDQWIAAETKFSNGRHWVRFDDTGFWPVAFAHSSHACVVRSSSDKLAVRLDDWSEGA